MTPNTFAALCARHGIHVTVSDCRGSVRQLRRRFRKLIGAERLDELIWAMSVSLDFGQPSYATTFRMDPDGDVWCVSADGKRGMWLFDEMGGVEALWSAICK